MLVPTAGVFELCGAGPESLDNGILRYEILSGDDLSQAFPELRDSIGGKLYSGTSEIQRLIIARYLGLSPRN